MDFATIERDYIRSHILPDFDWAHNATPSTINVLRKPIHEARVAVVTTCGAHRRDDPPFNLKSKTGDPTYREIPNDSSLADLRLSHVGYNTRKVSEDINCVFPLDRLRELQTEGAFGSLNHRHFSFMGYIPVLEYLLHESGSDVARKLVADGVDLVLLAPS